VAEVLDLIDRALLTAIAEACIDGDAGAALEACRRAWERGIDAKRLGEALLGTVRDLVVLRIAPDRGLVEGADAELAALTALAERGEEARLRRMFRALLREQEDLAWAPVPFAVLEMAVVRCATLAPGDRVEELLARIDQLERSLGGGAGGGPGGGTPPGRTPPSRGGSAPSRGGAPGRGPTRGAAPSASGAASAEASPSRAPEPPPLPAPASPRESAADETEEEPALGSESTPELGSGAPLDQVFDRLRAFAQEENRGLFAALEGGRLIGRTEQTLRISLPSAIAVRRFEARMDELTAVCERFFGHPLRVVMETEGAGGARPATQAAGPDPDAKRRRQEALNHPAVNQALEILKGEIVEIRPLGGEGPEAR
jgi:DNA polymerase-3 subunit gamma/tau